jgi:ADP-ribosylglycohydrolase
MLGAIAGDIVGSAYEFNNLRRKDFRPLFHAKARITDDTICTVAVADIQVLKRMTS